LSSSSVLRSTLALSSGGQSTAGAEKRFVAFACGAESDPWGAVMPLEVERDCAPVPFNIRHQRGIVGIT
jgi:hypothetical protein